MKNVHSTLLCLALCASACGGIDGTSGTATIESQSKKQTALDESGRNPQPAYRDPFLIVTRGPVSDDCVVVARVSDFNKVFGTIQQQLQAGGVWTELVAKTDINRSEPLQGCGPGSYSMRAIVERRNPNDYTFSSF